MPKSHRQRARLEQWLDNPRCDKNAASAVLNVPMLEVANHLIVAQSLPRHQVVAKDPRDISEFARSLGQEFEKSLFVQEPALMVQMLTKVGLLEPDYRVDVIHRLEQATNQEFMDESHRILRAISSADQKTALVINGFRLPATFLPPESTLEIDILVAIPSGEGRHELILGEVKVYPDKGGRTDRVQISGARSQLGLYAHIMREWLPTLGGIENTEYLGRGFFVLSDPATQKPVLSALENMDEQESRARTAIAAINELNFEHLQQESDASKRLEAISALDVNFNESCWGRCAMAEVCFAQVRMADSTQVLGTKIHQQLGDITLSTAVALADGQLKPSEPLELDLAERFADASFAELRGLKWKS